MSAARTRVFDHEKQPILCAVCLARFRRYSQPFALPLLLVRHPPRISRGFLLCSYCGRDLSFLLRGLSCQLFLSILTYNQPMKTHTHLDTAITTAAEIFAERGEGSPSLCDVRCLINDLTAENSPRWSYNQDKAFRRVRRILANN
jgi:hypothetical protein